MREQTEQMALTPAWETSLYLMVVVMAEDQLWRVKLVVLAEVPVMERSLVEETPLQHLQVRVLLVVLAAHLAEAHLIPIVLAVGEAVVRQALLVQPEQIAQEVVMAATEPHQV